MIAQTATQQILNPDTRAFYCRTLEVLNESKVDYLVGGAYAFARYTGIERHTKDFDIFVRPADCEHALKVLSDFGCETELTFPHWLGKAYCDEDFIDVIFSSGNGIARVDDEWFENAVEDEVLGISVKLCPTEEIIWSKAFIMERERFDGADIAHLLHASGKTINWSRLMRRFGPHWRVLLSHLVLFGFIYPGRRDVIPGWVMQELIERLQDEVGRLPASDGVCQGTLISRAQYLFDLERWGYQDGRLIPRGNMTSTDTAHWTAAIFESE